MNAESRLIVIGGGTAGAELAFAARRLGWPGPITIVGAEAHPPYHRPPLSKGFLVGKDGEEKLPLRPPAAYATGKIELLTGCEVVSIVPREHRVHLASGEVLAYDKLALCLGGRPRQLSLPGFDGTIPSNVLVLRDRAHADAIRAHLRPDARVVVIGGGYVGLEVAASARQLGANVTVLESQPRVLARVVGAEVSAFFERIHREAGVDVRTGVRELRAELGEGGRVVALVADGHHLDADVVIVGVGMEANLELARSAGIETGVGILVDDHARTSAEDVYAAGDCTELPGGRLYGRTIRLESVGNATEQARAAAAAICGTPRPYHPLPWFWSEQYDVKLQSVGLAAGHDEVVTRGDPSSRSFSVFYLAGGRLAAADTMNRPSDFIIAKRLVGEARTIDATTLADEARPMKTLLSSSLE